MAELHRHAAARDDFVPLAGGLPAAEMLPRRATAAAIAAVQAAGTDALQYGWVEGDAALRAWIADRLAARGAPIGPDDVIVTSGAQQAIALAAQVLVGAGARIHVGRATYPGALAAFAAAGATATVGLRRVDAAYVIAGVSNPTGVDALARRRDGLLAARCPILVDEAYAELRFDGVAPPPLLAEARDRVWHVGTASKTLSPGLRVGWLVPPPAWRDRVLERKHADDLQAGSLAQAALGALVGELDYDAHLARARRHYAARSRLLLAALARWAPRWRVVPPEGGFSVWVDTGEELDDVALLERAVAHGVSFDPGRMFRPADAGGRLAFRLSFSSAPPGELELGVRRLVEIVAASRPARRRRRSVH